MAIWPESPPPPFCALVSSVLFSSSFFSPPPPQPARTRARVRRNTPVNRLERMPLLKRSLLSDHRRAARVPRKTQRSPTLTPTRDYRAWLQSFSFTCVNAALNLCYTSPFGQALVRGSRPDSWQPFVLYQNLRRR